MSMRMSISQAAMAVLAGCGVTATTEYTAGDQASARSHGDRSNGGRHGPRYVPSFSASAPSVLPLRITCPDSKDCTHPNGPGIFFEELGSVGINAPGENVMMMITAFTNQAGSPSSVTFQGRYSDPFVEVAQFPTGLWLWTNGTIDSADYPNAPGTRKTNLQVVKVSEQNTLPTWTLFDPDSDTQMQVSDNSLVDLTLHATFTVANPALPPVQVLLNFGPLDIIHDTNPNGNFFHDHPVLYAYDLLWSPADLSQGPFHYCHRGSTNNNSVPDQVVFQQGISVDPVNGTVTQTPNDVTMSCAWGSVAKAYNWGYPYVNPQNGSIPPSYQAAIHMKRAAYCGDFDYHTIDGLSIGIRDDLNINVYPNPNSFPPLLSLDLEARWDSHGATCVNFPNMRHPDPQDPFVGTCPSKTLKKCDPPGPLPPGSTFIESYKAPQPQNPPGP